MSIPVDAKVKPMPMTTINATTDRIDNRVCPLADHFTVTVFKNISNAETSRTKFIKVIIFIIKKASVIDTIKLEI